MMISNCKMKMMLKKERSPTVIVIRYGKKKKMFDITKSSQTLLIHIYVVQS